MCTDLFDVLFCFYNTAENIILIYAWKDLCEWDMKELMINPKWEPAGSFLLSKLAQASKRPDVQTKAEWEADK